MIDTRFQPGQKVYYKVGETGKRYGIVADPSEIMYPGKTVKDRDEYYDKKDGARSRVWARWGGERDIAWNDSDIVLSVECNEQDHEFIPIEACGFVYQICRKCQKQQEEVV